MMLNIDDLIEACQRNIGWPGVSRLLHCNRGRLLPVLEGGRVNVSAFYHRTAPDHYQGDITLSSAGPLPLRDSSMVHYLNSRC
ncbi:hypothetical protein OS189_09990 [Sulfitobacter sp. F26169L]|nr:hypothetical protein [Sulfitobacter sp. F26169L]